MADALVDSTNDDARRQAVVANFFYMAGDLLGGVDSSPRYDPGENGGPMLGPRTNTTDVQVGDGGVIFQRGTTRQVGQQSTQQGGGLPLVPMLLVAAVVWMVARKG